MADFAGRVAIVTGASRGIGRAVATEMAARGARLVLVGRDHAALAATAALIDDHAEIVAGDVADPATADRAVRAARALGRLDVLANIAGAFPTALLADTDDAAYHGAIAANLTGTFMLCRAAAPLLLEAGEGAIVNISSTAARLGAPGLSVYSAAKAGIEAFGRAIAVELAPRVRVNTVSVGPTATEAVQALVASDTTGAVAAVTHALPLQRMAAPEEIAETILFLASPRTRFVTGQVWHVNGGGLMA